MSQWRDTLALRVDLQPVLAYDIDERENRLRIEIRDATWPWQDSKPPNATRRSFEIITGGAVINKMGKNTGWANGPLRSQCESISLGTDPLTGRAQWLLCQHTVWAKPGPGDSGGPVFLYENGVEGDRVWLAGIEHRSSETNLGVVFFYFSSMSQIQADLGSFVAY